MALSHHRPSHRVGEGHAEQSRLDMARFLAKFNRYTELGNDINLIILLPQIGNAFPPQASPMQDDSLHAALHTAASYGNVTIARVSRTNSMIRSPNSTRASASKIRGTTHLKINPVGTRCSRCKRLHGSARRDPQDPHRQQPEGEAACTIY